nr:hypothetical protein Iba_chr01aCG18230 [Ipomoea batatas]
MRNFGSNTINAHNGFEQREQRNGPMDNKEAAKLFNCIKVLWVITINRNQNTERDSQDTELLSIPKRKPRCTIAVGAEKQQQRLLSSLICARTVELSRSNSSRANSAMNQSNSPAQYGYSSRQSSAKSPSRFPGSRNAMLIRNPGPVNRHSCLHENGGTVLQSTPSAVSDSISIAATFSSRDSYSIPASSSSSFSAFPSTNGNVDGGEDERRLRYSSSSGEFKGAVDSSNGAELIISLSPRSAQFFVKKIRDYVNAVRNESLIFR